jgi:hypothetical protein
MKLLWPHVEVQIEVQAETESQQQQALHLLKLPVMSFALVMARQQVWVAYSSFAEQS